MADIRVRARASIGSIYHHFRSKEQLAAALYVEGLRDYQESFLAELDRRSRARDAVLALVRHHLQWIRKNPDLSRFLYDHRQSEFVTAAESAIKDLNEHFHRAGFSQWQRFVDKGEMIELPPDLLTAILLGPSQEFAVIGLRDAPRLAWRMRPTCWLNRPGGDSASPQSSRDHASSQHDAQAGSRLSLNLALSRSRHGPGRGKSFSHGDPCSGSHKWLDGANALPAVYLHN
jgi:AcrR family transcriptional regulator